MLFFILTIILVNKFNDPRGNENELQQRLALIASDLENRIKTEEPKVFSAKEKIAKITALTEKNKIEEAEKVLQKFLEEYDCQKMPAAYIIGDHGQSLIFKNLRTILKGGICPEYVKDAYYLNIIISRIHETENNTRQKDFEQVESNLAILEKMVKNGPIEIKESNKQALSDTFKEFYREAAQKYFSHDIEEPLSRIENLYTDIELSIVSYEEILAILAEAQGKIAQAKLLDSNKANAIFGKGKLLPPSQGAVFGTWSLDYPVISPKNSLIKKFEEQTGIKVKMDNIVMELQNADGELQSLDDPTLFPVAGKTNSLKIGPSVEIMLLRTWANGAVPSIEFHPHEHNSVAWHVNAFGRTIPEDKWISMQDIIDGKIDGYLARQAKILKQIGKPLMFRTINEFNAYAVVWPTFGESGRTSIFDICNGIGSYDKYFRSGKNLISDAAANLKLDCEEAYIHYGSPDLPDGPERVRDAWKHIHDVFDDVGAPNITWTAHSAPEHGAPNPLFKKVENWDKMEHYWPGRNYIDWGGISGYTQILEKDKNKQGTIFWTMGWWQEKIATTEWGMLPNILYEFSQIPAPQKNDFINWIKILMSNYLPNDFKNIKAIQWIPKNIPLENQKEVDAFKKSVAENPYWQGEFSYTNDYTPPKRINDLRGEVKENKIILSWTAPKDNETMDYYIIKYRNVRYDNHGGITKDFMKEPWRLWSRYDTKDIDNEPQPSSTGITQQIEINDLPSGTYYFGVQSINHTPYNSQISNIVEIKLKI